MRKKVTASLCVLVLSISLFTAAIADTMAISLSAGTWFGKTVEEAGKDLEDIGYKADSGNKTGLLKDIAWKYENDRLSPGTVNIWFDSDTRQVDGLVFVFSEDPSLFEQVYQSMTLLYGEPELVEQSEDVQQRVTITYPETYVWSGDTVLYNMTSTNRADDSVGTFKDVLEGKTGFSVRMFRRESEEETPAPTATPKPTATPRPVNVEISIDSVEIKDTRYGTREFYIRFKNNAAVTVDRIDFRIQGFNRYGERITQYNIDAVDFYYDDEIKPGKLSPKNYYYNYYMLDEATKIKIAILKYHTTNGKTIEVPEYQLKWLTFEK